MAYSGRVILHLDLDCFYCQVEQKRLGIPREVPAAVQQWDGLIAINYAARARGITRHMRVQEATRKCPELQCIHVQTLGGESGQEGQEGPVNAGSVHPNDRSLQKACLERYRRASAEIIAAIRKAAPKAKLEKASIDEVYLDVTPMVEKELEEREDAATSEHAAIDAFAWGSIVEGGPLDTESEYDRRLSVGASIACRLRGVIRERLDFTSSAGIAQNKLLAKVGSARNKPNQQTIVSARGITGLMKDLPLGKLRNFGGKLGAELQSMGATTAGEVAAIPFDQLERRFGERAKWISNCVRGLQDEPVTERELSKSMLAAKTFEATSDRAALVRWLGILAEELAERVTVDTQLNQRFPRLLVLSYRQKDTPAGRSRSTAMPRSAPPGHTAALIKDAAVTVLQRCPDAIPCCHLGLTATEFQDNPGDEQGCITRFFQPKGQSANAGEDAAPPQPPKALRDLPRSHQRNTIDKLFKKAAEKSAPATVMSESGACTGPPCRSPSQCQPETRAANSSIQSGVENAGAHTLASQAAELYKPPERLTAQHRTDTPAAGEQSQHIPETSSPASVARSEGEPGASLRDAKGLDCQCRVEDTTRSSRCIGETLGGSTAVEALDQVTCQETKTGCHPGGTEGESFELPLRKDVEGQSECSGSQGRTAADGDLFTSRGSGADSASQQEPVADRSPLEGETVIEGVDLEEQKRILHDIWVQKSLSKREGHKRKGTLQARGPKQPRLTDMFTRK